MVREPTAGGIIYKVNGNKVEILLIQDIKDRWTIPKGHIEKGETPEQTALREISEEVGLFNTKIISKLGRVDFRYRRVNKLVLMSTDIYLVKEIDANEPIKREKWMHDAKWFEVSEAQSKIEYEDIVKLLVDAQNKFI